MMCRMCLLAMCVLASCSRTEPAPKPTPQPASAAPQAATPPAKAPETARELIAGGKALVLDVRTPDEYKEDHVASAKNIPVDELERRLAEVEQLAGGDKTRPIVVYCMSGQRAARAKQTLEAAGFDHVVNGRGLDDLK